MFPMLTVFIYLLIMWFRPRPIYFVIRLRLSLILNIFKNKRFLLYGSMCPT